MILETWQIEILQHVLLDYKAWIDNVKNCGNFPDTDIVIQNKINVCFEKMLNENSSLDFTSLTDEEKVNLITSQEDYNNREERENAV